MVAVVLLISSYCRDSNYYISPSSPLYLAVFYRRLPSGEDWRSLQRQIPRGQKTRMGTFLYSMAMLGLNVSIIYMNPLSPHNAIKHHFTSMKTQFISLQLTMTKGFRRKISTKLVYQYMAIFFNFSPTSSHLHPLQVENCDSNSRLVVDEDDNGKFRLERVITQFHPF